MSAAAVLSLGDLDTGGAWVPMETEPELMTEYAAATGWPAGRRATGWSIVVGRLALTRGGRPLPPGGVLLGINLRSCAPPPTDGRWEFRVDTTVAPHRSGRPILTATVALRSGDGSEVAEVTFVLQWPETI